MNPVHELICKEAGFLLVIFSTLVDRFTELSDQHQWFADMAAWAGAYVKNIVAVYPWCFPGA